MVLQAVSARSARLLAAVCVTALSVLTVGAASARAAESPLALSYTCAFPLIGSQSISVTYGEHLPGSVAQGMPAGPVGTTADIAVPAIATEGLTLIGAATVSASAAGDQSVADGAARITRSVRYTVPGGPVPAASAFTIHVTGTFPSVTFPNVGTAHLKAGNLSLTLTPLDRQGQPTALGTFTAPCTLKPGQDNVLGTFQVRDPAASTTALTASPNPSVAGRPVTLTARVSPKSSSRFPTGKVTFTDGGTPLYTQVMANGTATVTTGQGGVPMLAAGSHVLTAVYHGDKNYAGSTSNTVTAVVMVSTTTSVHSSSNPSVQGQTVTYTATVSPAGGGGSVAFRSGGKPVTGCTAQSLNSSGKATCQVTYATTGSHDITAVYSGDAASAGSMSPVLAQHVVVDRADLKVALSMPTTAAKGSVVTQKVTVTNMGPATAVREVTALSEPAELAVLNAGGALVRGPLLTWSRTSLAPGASETYTVTVQVGSNASGKVQVAAGTVSVTQDPDMFNNLALVEISLG